LDAALAIVSACNCIKLNIYYSGFIIINSKKYFNFVETIFHCNIKLKKAKIISIYNYFIKK
jgi:hypothetical protein